MFLVFCLYPIFSGWLKSKINFLVNTFLSLSLTYLFTYSPLNELVLTWRNPPHTRTRTLTSNMVNNWLKRRQGREIDGAVMWLKVTFYHPPKLYFCPRALLSTPLLFSPHKQFLYTHTTFNFLWKHKIIFIYLLTASMTSAKTTPSVTSVCKSWMCFLHFALSR